MTCRYCGCPDRLFKVKHYPECAFSPDIPTRGKNVPPRIVDPFLVTTVDRKQLEREFNAGKWKKLPDGRLQKVELEIDGPR